YLLFVLLMALVLGIGPTSSGPSGLERFSVLVKLFTCMSAFGAVGLDLGVTAELNRWGQLLLVVGLFVGRLSILLPLSAVYGSRPQPRVGYTREELCI
ncbi:MAG: potassium transporter TrkG, partial [Cyanobium sp.]